jgi:hypothetical protein
MNIYALIAPAHNGPAFVTDPNGNVVYVEQTHTPDKDPRGSWTECVRTDDNTIYQPNHPHVVRGEPVFSFQGGRVYATFPLVEAK